LQQLLANKPDFHQARLYLITLMWQAQDPAIVAILERAVNLYPNQYSFRLASAKYHFQQQNLPKAESFLHDLDPLNINFSELVQMRAVIRQKQNKHQLAIKDYLSILQTSPKRGELFLAIGISLEALDQPKQALSSFYKAQEDHRLSSRQRKFIQDKIKFYRG